MLRALAVTSTVALLTTSCGSTAEESAEPLVIGVSASAPGLSMLDRDGTFSGFEVDLAAYVAEGLGRDDVRLEAVEPSDREQALVDGTVDLVVSSLDMTGSGSARIAFAGPYLTAGQDLLVRRNSSVSGPDALDGLTVCGVDGATAAVTASDRSPGAEVEEVDDLTSCVVLLNSKVVDAVTADDVALAGFARRRGGKLEVVGSPFTEVSYGIGLPKDSPDVDAVDDLLRRAVEDGSWQRFVDAHLGGAGWTPPPAPTPGA